MLALKPLQNNLVDAKSFSELLERHGWRAPSNTFDIADVQNLFNLTTDFTKIQTLLDKIIAADMTTAIDYYKDLFDVLKNIIAKVQSLSTKTAQPGMPFPFNRNDFWSEFPGELAEELLIDYLESYHPPIFGILTLLGIIEENLEDVSATTGRVNYIKKTVQWQRLPHLINPQKLFEDVYGWNTSQFKYDIFLERLRKFLFHLGVLAYFRDPEQQLLLGYYDSSNSHASLVKELCVPIIGGDDDNGKLFQILLSLLPLTPKNNKLDSPVGITLGPSIQGTIPQDAFELLNLHVGGGFEVHQAIRLEVRPDKVEAKLATASDTNLNAEISINYEPATPMILIGTENSNRLQISDFKAGFYIERKLDDPEFKVELETKKIEIIIDSSKADGFIKKIFGDEPQTLEFGGAIVWSSKTGLHFKGHTALKLVVPINQTISIVKIDSLALGVYSSGNNLDLTVGLTGSAKLGPLIVSVDNIGIKLMLKNAPAGELGLFGNLDLDFDFKPPDGLGLAMDSSFAKGGGYLYFDNTKGEYAGILHLEMKGIALKAIGLLNTKLPDGSPGFSLLIIISAEFQPIQLGFGFTLNGVGGLLGLNRTIIVEVLREGIKNHTLDSILFPEDPIRDAPKIISDLKAVFPPVEGQFVFGPMAKLGWGTPTIVTADVGVAIELPDPVRIVILGKVRAILPSEDVGLIKIRLDILGIIDFEKKAVSIDASLYDSQLLQYALSGDMALRANWGAEPLFVLSVGGLNPRFQPPPGFPGLSRLQVSMGVGNNPRLNLEAYLAITSNTVQFGALLELYAEALGFNVYGHLGFDCLFQLSPFEFIADVGACIAFRKGKTVLGAVNLEGTLSGPRPWHARGKASISLLLFEASVSFDERWGDEDQAILPAIDVWAELQKALADTRNWNAVLPSGSPRLVSYRNIDNAAGSNILVVDPFGSLAVRQKVVPLNFKITKFGNSLPAAESLFNINGATTTTGQSLPITGEECDLFAPAQFIDMSDDQKLSSPEFEKRKSGVRIGSAGVSPDDKSKILEKEVVYEERVIDLSRKKPLIMGFNGALLAGDLYAMSQFGSVNAAQSWNSGEKQYSQHVKESIVKMDDETYAIASTSDMSIRHDVMPKSKTASNNGGVTKTEAYATMKAYLDAHPEEKGNLQVVPSQEAVSFAI